MGKLKWVTKSVSCFVPEPPKFVKIGSFPSVFRQLVVLPVFAYLFRGHWSEREAWSAAEVELIRETMDQAPDPMLSLAYVCMCMCIYIYIYIYTYYGMECNEMMYACIHVSMYPCIHVSMYACVHAVVLTLQVSTYRRRRVLQTGGRVNVCWHGHQHTYGYGAWCSCIAVWCCGVVGFI